MEKSKFTKQTILSIIDNLVGEVSPVGDRGKDAYTFENLKLLCEVTDRLILKIDDIGTSNKKAYENSVKRSQEYAANFIKEIKETYPLSF